MTKNGDKCSDLPPRPQSLRHLDKAFHMAWEHEDQLKPNVHIVDLFFKSGAQLRTWLFVRILVRLGA